MQLVVSFFATFAAFLMFGAARIAVIKQGYGEAAVLGGLGTCLLVALIKMWAP